MKCHCHTYPEASRYPNRSDPRSCQSAGEITILKVEQGPTVGDCSAIFYCICKVCGKMWEVQKVEPDHCPDVFYYWMEVRDQSAYGTIFEGQPAKTKKF